MFAQRLCILGKIALFCFKALVYLDYSISSGPFLRFPMSFEFLSEMFDHSVCETRDPSLTKNLNLSLHEPTFTNIIRNRKLKFQIIF